MPRRGSNLRSSFPLEFTGKPSLWPIIGGAGRQDVWEYPETPLREAVVNALVHRDLSSGARGTQVQVEMYPDRLVIRNPGGLFGPVTVDSLGEEGISSARNASLIKLLEDVPLPGDFRRKNVPCRPTLLATGRDSHDGLGAYNLPP